MYIFLSVFLILTLYSVLSSIGNNAGQDRDEQTASALYLVLLSPADCNSEELSYTALNNSTTGNSHYYFLIIHKKLQTFYVMLYKR